VLSADIYPTSYPDINILIRLLLSEVKTVLGRQFTGLYLHGSLASGDFNPQTSDIDFLVVTAEKLPNGTVSALEVMHARLNTGGLKWAPKLEGSYIPLHALRGYDPAGELYPCLNEGRFYLDRQGSDWVIQRHILREQGLVVAGPPLQTLIDPVPPDDLRRAVLGLLHEWWAPMLHSPDLRLHGDVYQAYAVLTMCRALYTARHKTIVSKPVAARWALEALDAPRAALIERALAWRPGLAFDSLNETLDFIRYTLQACRQVETLADEE
jgi:predicted nucleotidyltransferase